MPAAPSHRASRVRASAAASASCAGGGSKLPAIRSVPAADKLSSSAGTSKGTVAAAAPPLNPYDRYRVTDPQRVEEAEEKQQIHTPVSTAGALHNRERAVQDEDETSERIRRHRYAELVMRLHSQRAMYRSTGVFVEAMLKEAQQHRDSESDLDHRKRSSSRGSSSGSSISDNRATQAAIATWGLKLLARESHTDVLTAILNALLPALYDNYELSHPLPAPPAVQLHVRDREVLDDNPYLSHAMYVDAAAEVKQTSAALRHALDSAVTANDERRSMVLRFMERQRQHRLRMTFKSWRSQVRLSRLIQLMCENKTKRTAEEMAHLRKRAAFYQWKVLVERSRGAYLTERLHDAAFQLENAKNQFQLQCYRADRLAQTTKEATDELVQVKERNDDLSRQVLELQQRQEVREVQHRKQLTRSVSRLLQLLSTYDSLAKLFIASKQRTAPRWAAMLEEDVNGEGEADATSDAAATDGASTIGKGGGTDGGVTPAGLSSGMAASILSSNDAHGDETWGEAEEVEEGEEEEEKDVSPSAVSLMLLRRWCNGVLSTIKHRDAPLPPFYAFGTAFADGERYLRLLQFVFPDVVSAVLAVRDMGVESRLRRIRDYAAQLKLRYILLPSDFIHEREDLLVCSLSEIYQRHVLRSWSRGAEETLAELDTFRDGPLAATLQRCAASSSPQPRRSILGGSSIGATPPGQPSLLSQQPPQPSLLHSTPQAAVHGAQASEGDNGEEEEEAEEPLLDEETVEMHIADVAQRLRSTGNTLNAVLHIEKEVIASSTVITTEEARLGSERLQGTPIALVEETHRRQFWSLPYDALADLREVPQLSSEAAMWHLATTHSLPAVLRECVDTTARAFFFFAGENAKGISEVAFWRFVEASGLLVSPADVPKEWIATQFDKVVSPQLDVALRAAARNQNEMSVQKLRQVAYQEMDIRTATPVQFTEVLVRVAVAAEGGEYGLVEGTRRLFQRLQLPQPDKLSPVVFELYTPESLSVLRFFNEDFFRVFLFYVKQQESSRSAQERMMATQDGGRFAALMSAPAILSLLEDCRFLSDGNDRGIPAAVSVDCTRPRFFVAASQVRKFAATLERQSRVASTGGLSFGLFIDLLATLAHLWCPDPLVPSSRRLAAFLAFTVQQLGARHINSTLLLGTAPPISLEGSKVVDFAFETNPLS